LWRQNLGRTKPESGSGRIRIRGDKPKLALGIVLLGAAILVAVFLPISANRRLIKWQCLELSIVKEQCHGNPQKWNHWYPSASATQACRGSIVSARRQSDPSRKGWHLPSEPISGQLRQSVALLRTLRQKSKTAPARQRLL
jgi:hypothetical protein